MAYVFGVPLRQKDELIGTLSARRAEVNPFSAAQIKLLETFADQAVIAIENVRLLQELQQRTSELVQSVGELKALGEVGQAVSSTLDLEIVLTRLVSHAAAVRFRPWPHFYFRKLHRYLFACERKFIFDYGRLLIYSENLFARWATRHQYKPTGGGNGIHLYLLACPCGNTIQYLS
jgi:hypothetical protein